MSSKPPRQPDSGATAPAHEPITAVCAAMYAADLVPAYAFVFRVPSSGTRFTVYADGARYSIGETYLLTLTASGDAPTPPRTDQPPADPEGNRP